MSRTQDKTPEQLEADRAFVEKIKTIRANTLGPSTKVREYRKDSGERIKKTMDEGGNVITQHAKNDRQDVHINAGTVTLTAG